MHWHTLGEHLSDAIPFWEVVAAGVPDGYASTPSAVTDVLASCTYSAVASIVGMVSSFMKPPD
jgi:hypothetical protein